MFPQNLLFEHSLWDITFARFFPSSYPAPPRKAPHRQKYYAAYIRKNCPFPLQALKCGYFPLHRIAPRPHTYRLSPLSRCNAHLIRFFWHIHNLLPTAGLSVPHIPLTTACSFRQKPAPNRPSRHTLQELFSPRPRLRGFQDTAGS